MSSMGCLSPLASSSASSFFSLLSPWSLAIYYKLKTKPKQKEKKAFFSDLSQVLGIKGLKIFLIPPFLAYLSSLASQSSDVCHFLRQRPQLAVIGTLAVVLAVSHRIRSTQLSLEHCLSIREHCLCILSKTVQSLCFLNIS